MKVVHCKKEPYDIYIGRPSKWGNPFTHIADKHTAAKYVVTSRDEAVSKYREWILEGDGKKLLNQLHELEGKTLGCWCCHIPSIYQEGMKMVCHGEVLMEIIHQQKNKKINDETI